MAIIAALSPVHAEPVISPIAAEARELSKETLPDFRRDIVQRIEAGDFELLDEVHELFRDGTEFFPNGQPKLFAFYNALVVRVDDGDLVSGAAADALRFERIADMKEWLAAYPDSVAARTSLASEQSDQAWRMRGNTMAHDVTEHQWRAFYAVMQEAIASLNEVSHPDPHTYNLSISAATSTGMPRETQDALFAEARARFPTYPYIYSARAMALLPKWGGAPGEDCELAKSLGTSTNQADKMNYSIVVEAMVEKPTQMKSIFDSGCLDWTLLKQSFDLRAAARGLANSDGNYWLGFSAAMHDRDTAGRAAAYITLYVPSLWMSAQEFNFFLNWPTNVRGPNDPPERPADRPMAPATVPLN